MTHVQTNPARRDRQRHVPLRLLLLILTLGTLGGAHAQDFRWLDVQQQVTVQPDGAVLVRDERTLTTDGDFGEAFICIELAEGQTLTLLGGGALSPGPAAEALQGPCEEGEGQEVVVRQAERVAERRVFFEYRLEGTLGAYRDVVAWYWEILERNHPPVQGYTLRVTAPGPMAAPYDAFVHRFDNPEEPSVQLSEDRSELSVAFDHIPDGDGVEIHYLMDPALFDEAFLEGGDGAPGLEGRLLEEARPANVGTPGAPVITLTDAPRTVDEGAVTLSGTVADEDPVTGVAYSLNLAAPAPCTLSPTPPWTFSCAVAGLSPGDNDVTLLANSAAGDAGFTTHTLRWRSAAERARANPLWSLPGLLVVSGLGAGLIRSHTRQRRGVSHVESMRYPFEPPSDRPPAAAALLSSRLSPNTQAAFHATIMDLARRGYGSFDSQGRVFNMHLDLNRDTSSLLPFEAQVLAYLKRAASSRRGDPAYLEFRELKRYSEKNLARFLSGWSAEVTAWLEGELGGPRLSPSSQRAAGAWVALGFLGAGLCGVGALSALGAAQGVLFLCALICGGFGLTAALLLPTWRPEIAPEAFGWMGFRRTLSDYSRMKDAPDDFFGLWDVYYCYAAALGVAERFLRNLSRAAPLRNLDEGSLASRAAWMGHGVMNSQSFRGVSSAASSLGSALSAAGASASSGGSVGGGGGGGGGGSSGGR